MLSERKFRRLKRRIWFEKLLHKKWGFSRRQSRRWAWLMP
jgi:hypothetical protein